MNRQPSADLAALLGRPYRYIRLEWRVRALRCCACAPASSRSSATAWRRWASCSRCWPTSPPTRGWCAIFVMTSDVPRVFNFGGDLALFVLLVRAARYRFAEAVRPALRRPGVVDGERRRARRAHDRAGAGRHARRRARVGAAVPQGHLRAQRAGRLPRGAVQPVPRHGRVELHDPQGRLRGRQRDDPVGPARTPPTSCYDAGWSTSSSTTATARRRSISVVRAVDPRLRGTLAALHAQRHAAPIAYESLLAIVDQWAETALQLTDRDLRLMERLARAQARKAGGADEGAVEEIKRFELETAWGEERREHRLGRPPHRQHRVGRAPRIRPRWRESQSRRQPDVGRYSHRAALLARVRLRQVGVHAGGERLRRVLVEGVGRQRDDRHPRQAAAAPRVRGAAGSRRSRRAPASGSPSAPGRPGWRASSSSACDAVARPRSTSTPKRLAASRCAIMRLTEVVLDHQHGARQARRLVERRQSPSRSAAPAAGEGSRRSVSAKRKRRAAAELALDLDRPPIASTMRWLIARPSPVPPRRPAARAVDLVEGLEHALHRLGRHADAGVAHLEAHAAPAVAARACGVRRSVTPPRSVNLMALPTRLSSTCFRRCASPTTAVGHRRARCRAAASAPWLSALARNSAATDAGDRVQRHRRAASGAACRPRSSSGRARR